MGDYRNTALDVVSGKGGVTAITISSNSANGPNQVCRECWLQAAISNTGYINVGLSSAVTSIKGLTLPKPSAVGVVSASGQPLKALNFAVENLNMLWFYGTVNSDAIAIVWRQ